jgi:hypothetical protein
LDDWNDALTTISALYDVKINIVYEFNISMNENEIDELKKQQM